VSTNELAGLAEDAYEAIRALNHKTQGSKLNAPTIYTMLDDLASTCHGMQQLLDQLGQALARSVAEDDVYDLKGDPRDTLSAARAQFAEAGKAVERAGRLIRDAHVTINSQGIKDPRDA
jgi:hypothetical protein